jgi:hypothetical protein
MSVSARTAILSCSIINSNHCCLSPCDLAPVSFLWSTKLWVVQQKRYLCDLLCSNYPAVLLANVLLFPFGTLENLHSLT